MLRDAYSSTPQVAGQELVARLLKSRERHAPAIHALWEVDPGMERIDAFQILMPTKVLFDVGAVARVGEETALLGSKALVVTAVGTMRSLGFTDLVEKSLGERKVPYELFEEVETNPSTDTVERGAALAEAKGCDVVIGLGGGSAVDAAKAIASSAGLRTPIVDLMRNGMPRKGLPCLAIPTTSGTGAEVSPISVLTIRADKRKDALRGAYNFPSVALLDPALTLKLPPYITANTGIEPWPTPWRRTPHANPGLFPTCTPVRRSAWFIRTFAGLSCVATISRRARG